MNKFLIFITLIGSVLGLNAQMASPSKADTSQTAKIVFEKTVHDYGTIAKGSDGTCSFKFTNKGKVPLSLASVIASCGCTTPSWPRAPIDPGKSGNIDVKYNTNLVGNFSKSITVKSNAENSAVILQIKGVVK